MAKGLGDVLRFGRYEPLFRIGIGGMAEVYAARIVGEAGFQKLVAVKRMLPHLSGDQKFVDMFLDEARLAANISSPHIVQTLDLGRADDDSLYIVMELVVGVTLADFMRHQRDRGERIDHGVVCELIAQAAQGLDDAHEARAPGGKPLHLVHRDVSPQNILVGMDGRARVSDFGIAHAVYLRRTHTQVGEKKGKFSYFSPEQSHGTALDRRSDIFSLGIVAWELLCGRRLFKGQQHEALLAVREKPIPPPSRIHRDIPQEVSDAVMHALERDPDRRYPTGGQMAAALRRAALGLGDPPTPRAIGRLVEEIGGEDLRRMQSRIAGGGADPRTGTAVLPPDGTDPLVSQDLVEVGTMAASVLVEPETHTGPTVEDEAWPTFEDDAGPPTVEDVIPTAVRDDLDDLPTATPAPTPAVLEPTRPYPSDGGTPVVVERSGVPRLWWLFAAAALGLVAIAGGGVAAWVAAAPDEEPAPAETSASPELTARPASPATEVADVPSEPAGAAQPAAVDRAAEGAEPERAEHAEPELEDDDSEHADDDTEHPERAAAEPEPERTAECDDVRRSTARTDRAERVRLAARRRAERERARRAAAETMRRAQPEPDPPRDRTTTTTMSDTTMSSPIPGLDAFDRSVQR